MLQQHGITAQALTTQDVAAARHGRHANVRPGPALVACPTGKWWTPKAAKLVGLAQRCRRNGVLLVAGTLVSKVPWALLCTALDHPQKMLPCWQAAPYPWKSCWATRAHRQRWRPSSISNCIARYKLPEAYAYPV